MKKVILTGLFALCFAGAFAQSKLINLRLEGRFDAQSEYVDGARIEDNCGFKGKFINIRMDGDLGHGFTYSYRQRLNKAHSDQSYFDATDWLKLTYTTGNWSFSGGKQVVGIGGYEYDRAPIDTYNYSEYCSNIACYQIGVSAGYTTDNGKDYIMVQSTQSPFRANAGDMYAYNIIWYGSHGWFNSIYSANMIEYLPGKFISYIVLGNKFNVGDFSLELDIMNRATDSHTYFGKDMSVIGELSWTPNEQWRIFGKASYDVNNTDSDADYCVLPGTEITRVGIGVEHFLIKGSKDVRLHFNGHYTFGNNGNPTGALIDKQSMVDAGITWRVNIF